MEPADLAYQRVRKPLYSRSAALWGIRVLAVLEALLALALLGVAGLIAALLATRGVTHLDTTEVTKPPNWLVVRVPEGTTRNLWLSDTGLSPLVVENDAPDSPWPHRALAALLRPTIDATIPLQSNRSALFTLLATWLGMILTLWLVGLWRRRTSIVLSAEIAESLRHQIHRQMYRLGQSALPNEGIGPVINLFTREVNDIRDGLYSDLDRRVRLLVFGVGLLVLALLISIPLTIYLLSLIGLCLLIGLPLIRSARAEADQSMREAGVQLVLLHEDLGLVRTVRVFGMEEIDRQRFDEHLESYHQGDLRRMRSEGSIRSTTLLLVGIGIALALGPLGYVELGGETSRLSLGAILVLAIAIGLLAWVVRRWLDRREALQRAGRSSIAVFEYLDQKPELLMSVGARFLPPLKSRLTFENVTVEGSNGRPIVSGVSAEIRAGTRNAIVGLEEGETLALACLIPRLLDPAIGRVRIDGIDLRDVTLESLRAQVATILNADMIFSDSVLANIGLGDPSFTLPRVIEAAKTAHAHHVIQNLPEGYETLLGPMGHYLQPDERYRIALARVFLHDPSIVIIEEPHDSIDEEIKPLIDDTLDRLAQNRTLVFLPHRLSTIRKCDQVIVVHNGRVEIAGPPREVYQQSKLYRHIQYVAFNKFATGEIEVGQIE